MNGIADDMAQESEFLVEDGNGVLGVQFFTYLKVARL